MLSSAPPSSVRRRSSPISTPSQRTSQSTVGRKSYLAGQTPNPVSLLHAALLKPCLTSYAEFFSPICTVYADTSRVLKEKKLGPRGAFYTQGYDIVILCGMTEMKAQICWIENVSLYAKGRFNGILTLLRNGSQGVEKR